MHTKTRSICAQRRGRLALSAGVAAVALAAASGAQAGRPQAAAISADIPRQPLEQTLLAVSRQSGVQVVMNAADVAGVEAPAIAAGTPMRQAVHSALGGSQLTAEWISPATVAVKRRPTRVQRIAFRAAQEPKARPAAAPEDTEVGEVVVTAQKRVERLLDVPMSITAVSADALQDAVIGSTGDLQQVSPGLVTVSNGLSFTPAIRGISSVGTSPGDEANVSIYLDDVYLGATIAGLFDLKDIERVEVLKGPQGTLFGRNATGGAIRIVTRAPSFDFRGDLAADYGFDFNEVKLSGYVSGPLTDTIAGSLTGYYIKNDGYAKGIAPHNRGRDYAVSDNYSLRGKLLFQPVDSLKVVLSADYSDRRENAVYIVNPKFGQNSLRTVPGVIIAGPFEFAGSTEPRIHVLSRGAGVDISWESPEVSIRSISAYRTYDGLFRFDSDRTNLSVAAGELSQGQKTFSQEFNFAGPAERTITWVAGLYYYHSDAFLNHFRTYLGDAPGGFLPATPVVNEFANDVDTDSFAGFGELTFNPTDRLHLTLGARYTYEKKRLNYFDVIRAAGLRTAFDEHKWQSPSYRAVARYDFAPDANVYASFSTGFKSGVYNSYNFPVNVVQPEKITAYEAGVKARVSGVTVTGAVFHYDYRDIQVQAQNNIAGVLIVTLTNAAKAKVTGVEANVSAPLGDHFTFDAGVSALPTAKYSRFTSAQVFVPNAAGGGTSVVPFDASGSRIIRAPKLQANARLSYDAELMGGKFKATASYSYNSGFYWQAGNLLRENAYRLVNARIAWTEPSDRVTFSVWGENLTDDLYSIYTAIGAIGVGSAWARPRQIGVGVAAKF